MLKPYAAIFRSKCCEMKVINSKLWRPLLIARTMDPSHLRHKDYTVGWICALPTELTAARAMLDKAHPYLPLPLTDANTYCLGRIGEHNIAIACLPKGEIGNNPAATVATRISSSFQRSGLA
jgi:hypothetical protein